MKTFRNLSEKEKISIATHYANIAYTRNDTAVYFNISKETVTKCLHCFIENVFICENMELEDTEKLCRRIMSKAIGNVEAKALEKGFSPNPSTRNKYTNSIRTRKINLEIYYESLNSEHYESLQNSLFEITRQINNYYELSSEDQDCINIEELKKKQYCIMQELGQNK